MELSETDFFDTLTIQNDQISYVKHVLAPLYVFFTLFGWREGGLPRGLGHNLLMQFFSLSSSRMVVPLPSLTCLAEGNRIFYKAPKVPKLIYTVILWFSFVVQSPPPPQGGEPA